MIKTLIVEDEKIILEDLLDIIDWKHEGFEIVATAANGKQGLLKFDRYMPDLVITDIRMPVMSGLDMLRTIRHEHESTLFLILSAYDEFEYAKSAVRLGAEDYILKTEISEEYLRTKLSKIRQKLNQNAEIMFAASKQKLQHYIRQFSPEADKNPECILPALNRLPNKESLKEMAEYAYFELIQYCKQLDIESTIELPDIQSIPDLCTWLNRELENIYYKKKMIYEKHYSPIIINAVEYIRQNYTNPDLKISTIANAVGLSSGRLSVLFKKELGSTLNDFITQVRIDEAKKLLSSGNYKVYEVSEMVGYKTSQYFSQIFFQYTNQYPNSYRKGYTDDDSIS